jgi:amidohydrolase
MSTFQDGKSRMEISEEVGALNAELVQLRRDFHQHPELGFEEFRTAERITDYLKSCGLETRRVTKTGVVSVIEGHRPGQVLLLRADMDALPIQEENDLPYRSVNSNKMHACGHDGHTAMLLVAAKILSQHRDQLRGKAVLVFQPNEENAGALPMIHDGLLKDFPVDACMGLHLWPSIPTGRIGISAGPVMAGMLQFVLRINGRGGHTGYPHQAVDPVLCAANIIQSLQMIQTREISVFEPTIIMIGKISGGTASNIIPDSVTLEGTARYLHEDAKSAGQNIRERMERLIAGICRAHQTDYALTVESSSLAVVNDGKLVELVRSTALQTLGDEKNIVRNVSTAGEDFSEFSSRIPGVFYFLGCGDGSKTTGYPHHHPRFNIDEEALKIGVEMHVRTAFAYLNKDNDR